MYKSAADDQRPFWLEEGIGLVIVQGLVLVPSRSRPAWVAVAATGLEVLQVYIRGHVHISWISQL